MICVIPPARLPLCSNDRYNIYTKKPTNKLSFPFRNLLLQQRRLRVSQSFSTLVAWCITGPVSPSIAFAFYHLKITCNHWRSEDILLLSSMLVLKHDFPLHLEYLHIVLHFVKVYCYIFFEKGWSSVLFQYSKMITNGGWKFQNIQIFFLFINIITTKYGQPFFWTFLIKIHYYQQ